LRLPKCDVGTDAPVSLCYSAPMVTGAHTMHPFEKAGLGLAPFRCVGVYKNAYQACPGAPIQAGGSCDFCGTGIMYEYKILSSDGKGFKVGCDCVAKTGGESQVVGMRNERLKIEREARKAKREARYAERRATHELGRLA